MLLFIERFVFVLWKVFALFDHAFSGGFLSFCLTLLEECLSHVFWGWGRVGADGGWVIGWFLNDCLI